MHAALPRVGKIAPSDLTSTEDEKGDGRGQQILTDPESFPTRPRTQGKQRTMRIGIREQLALLVLFTSMVALAVVSIATWVNNFNFVVNIKSQGLSLTASLKAAQVNSDLQLLQSTCGTIVTRILIQSALQRFYAGNTTDANWVRAVSDIQSALASGGYSSLLQVVVYPRNKTGDERGLLNITGNSVEPIALPYNYSNGTAVMLGDPGPGFPPMLYPNLTYVVTNLSDPAYSSANLTNVYAFPNFELNASSSLLLGPVQVNSSFSMVSLTLPIINNTSNVDILGFMTIVADSSSLNSVLASREGLDTTGIVLLVGPANKENLFPSNEEPTRPTQTAINSTAISNAAVSFIFMPSPVSGQDDRHNVYESKSNASFTIGSYPAIFTAFSTANNAINNASSDLTTSNEQGASVAVGWARPQNSIVDWVLLIEQTHDEAWAPVIQLRNILLACVFGTAGGIALLVIPMAHYSVLPIRRLKDATEKSVQPPGYTPEGSVRSEDPGDASGDEENPHSSSSRSKQGNGMLMRLRKLRRGRLKSAAERTEDARRRVFKIPGKVQDRKHFVKDELTELTTTFNEMSDELMMQYSRLEERVAERTRELEISKKAAEAANESKTLFIANISHELKTPLNGILGMCAVCMGEDDLDRIKKSLQVVYKSGDLLLHLLNDLLTFSKNQIGQSLSLEEKEFSLSDVRSQIKTIFDKQVREGHINFGVNFISTEYPDLGMDGNPEKSPESTLPAIGPHGTGRLKDMRLWGDQHRILQVIINLVSNSLKFTPEGGKVEVRIKCIGEVEKSSEGSKQESIGSRQGSQRMSRNRHRVGSGSNTSVSSKAAPGSAASSKPVGTALVINPMAPKTAQTQLHVRERSPTPPPANATTLLFEFEVEDTGPGISPALQQRVFEPFVQGDLGLSKKYGGTGLGLSICSQLATLMGGTITLESKIGSGSTFTMRIPLKFVRARATSTTSSEAFPSRTPSLLSGDDRAIKRVSSDASPIGTAVNTTKAIGFEKDPQPRLVGLSQPFFASGPATSPDMNSQNRLDILDRVAAGKSPTDKIRVLVAEDNLVNQEVVLRMLKLEDIYNVTVAKDGQEAYDMVKASMENGKEYNLIFMDIQMPNLDGLQSTRLIRQMGYSAPIVALTAFAEESNVQECMDSGMDMFLSKPIRRPALKQVLQKFATIPEESEPGTLSRRNTLDDLSVKAPDSAVSSEKAVEEVVEVNGVSSDSSSPP